jgi:hypothetical protein
VTGEDTQHHEKHECMMGPHIVTYKKKASIAISTEQFYIPDDDQ